MRHRQVLEREEDYSCWFWVQMNHIINCIFRKKRIPIDPLIYHKLRHTANEGYPFNADFTHLLDQLIEKL
jgi:hypothetical protein